MSTTDETSQPDHRLKSLRAVAPLVCAVAIVTAGGGLLTIKTSLELAIHDAATSAVSAIVTGYPLGFLVGCACARQFILAVGHGRTFQLMATAMALATCTFLLSSETWAWTGLRFINGFCMAAMFTVAESWINLDAGLHNRGVLISFYMIMSTLGLTIGQTMINLGDPAGDWLFVLAALVCLSAVVPFQLRGALRPAARAVKAALPADETFSFRDLMRVAPVAVIAAVQTGMTNMNFGVMGPIYATHTGHNPATAAALVTAFSLGGVLAQAPTGWLSDRIDRRFLLTAMSASAALCCLMITLFGHVSVALLFALFFLYGATALSIYPLAIAHAGSRVEGRYIVAISGRLLLAYSAGSVIAPAITNEMMAHIEPAALFIFLGGTVLAVATACIVQIIFESWRSKCPPKMT